MQAAVVSDLKAELQSIPDSTTCSDRWHCIVITPSRWAWTSWREGAATCSGYSVFQRSGPGSREANASKKRGIQSPVLI